MIQSQGTGTPPDTTTAEGGRHAADTYTGPVIDLVATPHRRAAIETETEAAS
jgi:hypothetical protein